MAEITWCTCSAYHRRHEYNRELCSRDAAKDRHQGKS